MKLWNHEKSFLDSKFRRPWSQFPATLIIGSKSLELDLIGRYCSTIFEVYGGTSIKLPSYLSRKIKDSQKLVNELKAITDNGKNATGYFLGQYYGRVTDFEDWKGVVFIMNDHQLRVRGDGTENVICESSELKDRKNAPTHVKKLLSIYTTDDAARLAERIGFAGFDHLKAS